MAGGHGPNPGAMGDSPLPPHIPQAKLLPYPREEENSHPKRHNSPKPPPGLRGEGKAAAAATSGVPPPALGTVLFFGDFGDPPGWGLGSVEAVPVALLRVVLQLGSHAAHPIQQHRRPVVTVWGHQGTWLGDSSLPTLWGGWGCPYLGGFGGF